MARSSSVSSLLMAALLVSCAFAFTYARGGSDDGSSHGGRHSGIDDPAPYYHPSPVYSPKPSPHPSPKPKPNCGYNYCTKYQKCVTSSYKYKVCVDIKKEVLCVDRTCKLVKEKCEAEKYEDKKTNKWLYRGKCKKAEGW